MTDRLVKNPERVPPALWSSGPGPVGLNPGGRYVIDGTKESIDVAKIDKTGVYENADGDRVFYAANHPVHEDVLADLKTGGRGAAGLRHREAPPRARAGAGAEGARRAGHREPGRGRRS
jgi:hypothetical protein